MSKYTMLNILRYTISLLLLLISSVFSRAYAQVEFLKNGYEEKYFNYNEGPGVEVGDLFNNQSIKYMYDSPDVKNMSNLFWSLGLYKTSDDWAVDEYMRINECDLYKRFYEDDFEWVKIRNSTKKFIDKNLREFPTRFAVTIPLKLRDYDNNRKLFTLQDKYQIKSARRFQVTAVDYSSPSCSYNYPVKSGYPRSLNLEFSRPFNLVSVSMSKERADEYIKAKNLEYNKLYSRGSKGAFAKYSHRDLFLVMNVKIFAYGKTGFDPVLYLPILQVMGILESYEIYEDREKAKLIYRRSFLSNDKVGGNLFMDDQYKELMELSKGGGVMR